MKHFQKMNDEKICEGVSKKQMAQISKVKEVLGK